MASSKSNAELKRRIESLVELISQLEDAGVTVPNHVKLIIQALDEGKQIGMAAEEAAAHLANFAAEMEGQCKRQFPLDDGDVWVCLAKEATRGKGNVSYSGRVNATLNLKNPNSVAAIYWRNKRGSFGCVWDEIRNNRPSGLFYKCFLPGHPRSKLPVDKKPTQ